MLQRAGLGFGWLALTQLLLDEGVLAAGAPEEGGQLPHFQSQVRSVIFLFMGGGPSHVDTWDPKPELNQLHGKDVPESIAKAVSRHPRLRLKNLYASPYKFTPQGQSGIPVSELFPQTGKWVDDLCLLRSCRHSTPVHAPAEYLSTTGTQIGDRPSLGSWLCYGLGSENRNLPGFIVFRIGDEDFGSEPAWGAGFLPARYQGTMVKSKEGIADLNLPSGSTPESRAAQLTLVERLNRRHLERHGGLSELEARIRSFELSFGMQAAAPEAFDLGKETDETGRLYGLDHDDTTPFGTCCLLARRLVERGVRFIQLRFGGWDAHGNLLENHRSQCKKVDRPIAGLLADLKRTGLLDETLVIWGGEFGRTPTAEGSGATPGRDHSPNGYSMWLAGGGVKGGQVIGATDAIGYAAIERPIHPNDLHATILHALGIDQHGLFYVHNNRREMVTVNGGQVIADVFG
jgi:hypothetical protein